MLASLNVDKEELTAHPLSPVPADPLRPGREAAKIKSPRVPWQAAGAGTVAAEPGAGANIVKA
jgi:hypothetical protein